MVPDFPVPFLGRASHAPIATSEFGIGAVNNRMLPSVNPSAVQGGAALATGAGATVGDPMLAADAGVSLTGDLIRGIAVRKEAVSQGGGASEVAKRELGAGMPRTWWTAGVCPLPSAPGKRRWATRRPPLPGQQPRGAM